MTHERSKDVYVAQVQKNSSRLADVADRGMAIPVPTCPGWYAASVVAHLGEVQRHWALQLREHATKPIPLPPSTFEELPGLLAWFDGMDTFSSDPAAIPPGLVEWLRQGTAQLVAAFEPLETEAAVWHWSGDNRAIVHMRNQALEAAVHRWDVENARNTTTPIDHDLTLDGIDQHFEVQIPAGRANAEQPAGQGETFHFHRTDGPGEWFVRFSRQDFEWEHSHTKADLAIRGAAEDIFLWLWGRGRESSLEFLGKTELVSRYRELACTHLL